MLFKLGRNLVDVVLGLVVLRLERGYALALLFEEAQEALLLALVKVQALELDRRGSASSSPIAPMSFVRTLPSAAPEKSAMFFCAAEP